MLKRLIPLISLFALTLAACNSSEEEIEYESVASSDVAITSFQLVSNPDVLDSLSNVYFSIDLLNARIFNADSLPYGTNISRLVTLINTNSASGISIAFPRPGLSDSIIDYKTNSTDSVDFSNGPVKITITSESGSVSRTYEVKVNVHTIKPDTLAWNSLKSISLPSTLTDINAQYAARKGDTFYCLTSSSTEHYCLAATTDPDAADWNAQEISLGFTPDVTSLRATGTHLYILSASGRLYDSADGIVWSDTGVDMSYIYGPYNDQILGSDGSSIVSYPSGHKTPMPEGFPVRGTSLPASYTSSMATSDQIVIIGGVCADGTLSPNAWGYDGNQWACLSMSNPLPEGVESPVLVAYDLFDVPLSTWSPVKYPALVAFGGKKADGSISRTVYISKDWGMNWQKAPELMALPEKLPALYYQPSYVYSTTLHARSSKWADLGVRPLYPFASFVTPASTSRATTPITQWECPAIYLFGGLDAAGNVNPTIWRGVISRYTFKPVQ